MIEYDCIFIKYIYSYNARFTLSEFCLISHQIYLIRQKSNGTKILSEKNMIVSATKSHDYMSDTSNIVLFFQISSSLCQLQRICTRHLSTIATGISNTEPRGISQQLDYINLYPTLL